MDVAVVTANGLVTGLKTGETVITVVAADNSLHSDDCTITVTEADPPLPEDIVWVTARYTSSKDIAVSKMPDFELDDYDVIDGKVTLKKSIAEKISKVFCEEILEKTDGIKAIPLPWFEAAVEPGKVAAVRISVEGSLLYSELPEGIILLKILTPTSGQFLQYVSMDVDYDDGRFTVLKKKGYEQIENINKNEDYDLVVFIRDGGEFDLDKRINGFVVDPIVIVNKNGESRNGGGSSVGCSAFGFLAFSLLGIVPFVIWKKRVR
jgi:hypothetical protein